MTCGSTYRDCADLPDKDSLISNVSGISFANGPSGITVSWSWGTWSGDVAIAIILATIPYTRPDYAVVASPTTSELMALTVEGEYFISVRREHEGEASAWSHHKMLFIAATGAEAVEHNGVQLTHTYGGTTDYVIHTRVDQFLEVEAGDYLLTEASENISME